MGPWRVVGWGGRGTYGAVYRAERVGQESAGPVALKLAVHAEDPRFAREAALLARIHHPGVPELLGHGQWQNGGHVHPYLVMQWVEGLPQKLPPSAWSREDAAAASELGHRPCYRVRAVVEAAEQQDRAARAGAARREPEELAHATAPTGSARPQGFERPEWLPWLATVAVCAAFTGFIAWKAARWQPAEGAAVSRMEVRDDGSEDGGTAELAEDVLSAHVETAGPPQGRHGIRLELPKKPLPGQRRPESTGRCRRQGEVAIHGGCWEIAGSKPPCGEGWYEWQGACYFPVRDEHRSPTSDPP